MHTILSLAEEILKYKNDLSALIMASYGHILCKLQNQKLAVSVIFFFFFKLW